MGFEMVARLSCEANHQNSCITKQILHHSNPTTQKPKGKCHTSLCADHPNHPVTFQGGFSFTEPGKKITKLWWEGRRGTLPFYRKESSGERICVRLSCLFLNVYVYIYIFESIREDQLFQGSSVCTSGARAAAVWIKQAGSFPVLHTATTAASNRVLWQVYNWSFVTLSCRWVVQLHWIQARLWPCIHERWVEAYLLNISVLNATLL